MQVVSMIAFQRETQEENISRHVFSSHLAAQEANVFSKQLEMLICAVPLGASPTCFFFFSDCRFVCLGKQPKANVVHIFERSHIVVIYNIYSTLRWIYLIHLLLQSYLTVLTFQYLACLF